jgi:hypothetical protein
MNVSRQQHKSIGLTLLQILLLNHCSEAEFPWLARTTKTIKIHRRNRALLAQTLPAQRDKGASLPLAQTVHPAANPPSR